MKRLIVIGVLAAVGLSWAATTRMLRVDAVNGRSTRTVQHTTTSAVDGYVYDTAYSDTADIEKELTANTAIILTARHGLAVECDSCVAAGLSVYGKVQWKTREAEAWTNIDSFLMKSGAVTAGVNVLRLPPDSIAGTFIRVMTITADSIDFKAADTTAAKLLLRKTYVPLQYDVTIKP